MFWRLLLPAFLACVCNSLANALWKLRFDKTPLSLRGVEDVIGLLRSPNIWGGDGVLRRFDASFLLHALKL